MARSFFNARMTRPSLLIVTASLSLFAITPSVFAASIVRTFSPSISGESDAGKLISLRALDRLHVARADVAGSRISLANGRLGGWLMLSGAPAAIAGPSLELPDQLSGIATCDANVPASSVPSQAPAATEAVGPASAFGVVPEPSSLALLGLGACSFLGRRRS